MISPLIQSIALCLLGALQLVQAQTVPAPVPVWKGLQYPADVLIDKTGRQTLADIQNRFERGESKPVSGNASQPFNGQTAVWFRINLPAVSSQVPAVMTVEHAGMDDVVLYSPMADGGWRVQVSGDLIPVAQWAMPHLHPAFALDVSPTDKRPVYMAIRHGVPVGVNWLLWDRASFDNQNKLLHTLLGGYMGFIFLVIVLSFLNAFNWRDSIHLIYGVHVLLLGGAQLSLTGIAGEYFWPNQPWWNDIAAVFLPMLSGTWTAFLIHRLVVERGQYLISGLLISVMVVGTGLSIAFLVLGRAPVFYVSNLFYLCLFAIHMGALIWFAIKRPRVGLWALAGFTCLLIGSLFPIFRNLNLIPVNFYTQYAAQIGAGFEIPMVLVALYFRSRERRDNQIRLSMLSRVDPLTGVVSHRLLMSRLEKLLMQNKRDPLVGAVLRVRLMNADTIQGAYGPELAQAAVVRTGACAALPVLDSDTVGRYIDGDFVVLLGGKSDNETVAEAAQRIIAHGLRPSRYLPGGVVLQLRVACADASVLNDDAANLMARLGSVLDEVTNQPAKTLRFLRQKATA